MPKRRRRKVSRGKAPTSTPPLAPGPVICPTRRRIPAGWWLFGSGIALGLVLWIWLGGLGANNGSTESAPPNPPEDSRKQAKRDKEGDGPAKTKKTGSPGRKDPGGSFLEAFGPNGNSDNEPLRPALTDAELEKKFEALSDTKDQIKILADRARSWTGKETSQERQAVEAEGTELAERFKAGVAALEKDLGRARKARPKAAVPEGLTGELLILVNGEPDTALPFLRRAVDRGLASPRILANLARVQTETNRLQEGYQSAARALDQDGKDRYAWQTFTRTAFYTERFAEVSKRLKQSFPQKLPDWAEIMRKEAEARLARWEAEQKLRQAEQLADNLPLVRLTIEHRRFVPGGTKVESTGVGDVILELFEDQAPATVANFLSLVEKKAYDGTRFFLAAPAALAAGGDPASKTGDPRDDGAGGPGYVIPDEFDRPGARGHWRGSLSMMNHGPHTAGSQFCLTIVPMPEMDGQFTCFGRVRKGQDVVDRITLGRTNNKVHTYGRPIPGDLLLRAEVLRKRDHEYRVTREPAK
jgi:cyclophilin family peptidyl-prolyl cis-trans isomerase